MTRVSHYATEWIAENRRRLHERDFVFGQICRSFLSVPFELQRQHLLYLPRNKRNYEGENDWVTPFGRRSETS